MDWTDALEYKTDYDDIIRYLEEKECFHDYRIVKPEGMPGGYIVSAWKRARADVQGNIPPAEKNAV